MRLSLAVRTLSAALGLITLSAAAPAFAQMPAALSLTAEDALKLALDHNVDLASERFGPKIGDTQVASAQAVFRPILASSLQRNNQLQPPSNLLLPTSTRTDVVTSSVSLGQRLERFGTSYSLSWDSSHTDSNSILNSYNPLLRSGLTFNVSQPILRDRKLDSPRLQRELAGRNRDISDIRVRESVAQTSASVRAAYWNLYSAKANVEARRSALAHAEELARVNAARVNVGQSPPLDLATARAEVASNQEQLIVAEAAVQSAEDALRMLIFDPTDPAAWTTPITLSDTPPNTTVTVNVEQAVANALRDRTDLVRQHKELDNSAASLRYSTNQLLPDVRVNAGYSAAGLGGTQIVRTGGFPGTVVGGGQEVGLGSMLGQVFTSDYPTWSLGLSVSYPLGATSEQASVARARLEQDQATVKLKSAEGRVIQQVREAARKVETNAKRIDVARVARELAEQRLDAEQKRFDVGLSTNFLVIQAQRDLSQAKTNELSAVLAYDLALVELETVQQAPLSGGGQSSGGSGAASAAAAAAASSATARRTGNSTGSSSGVTLP